MQQLVLRHFYISFLVPLPENRRLALELKAVMFIVKALNRF